MRRPVRIGIGGPVGSGKTATLVKLLLELGQRYSVAAITNDIFTREDADFVTRSGAVAPERVVGVETGGCPHTAIREDVSMNEAAVQGLMAKFPDLDILFIESGGDNLAATFSPELVDTYIYVIDVAEGEKIPRKGGPGITKSPLLLINKRDLAPYVGANLDIMDRDARTQRGERPYFFTNMREDNGASPVVRWIEEDVLFVRTAGADKMAGNV